MEQHETLPAISLCSPYLLPKVHVVTHLQTITAIRLPVDHVQNLILHSLAHRVASCPIVSRTGAFLVNVKVLRVVDIAVRAIDDAVNHSRLEVQHDRARDVARVVGLVKEDIFAVAASVGSFGGVWVKVTVLVDAMFKAQLLPEL